MRIIVDIMGGDQAPEILMEGAMLAAEQYGIEIALVGDEALIHRELKKWPQVSHRVSVHHADDVVLMEDRALSVVREKDESSMAIGLKLLSENMGDAFVSAGNTGALMAGATLIVHRIKGIHRAGIATILPFATPCLLMDSGANLEVDPRDLEQFAYMGSLYMERILGVDSPRVGILNNGTESTKGRALEREAHLLFSDADFHFIGNVEGRDVPFGVCDVLVTDGFTGNILLKYTEGMGRFVWDLLSDVLKSNPLTKISAQTIRGKIRALKHTYDSSEYGGAPLLGIAKPVIKAHGSSDANAIMHAIKQAVMFSQSGINRDIAVFSLGHSDQMKLRAKARNENEKAKEKAEKAARKQKKKGDIPQEGEA